MRNKSYRYGDPNLGGHTSTPNLADLGSQSYNPQESGYASRRPRQAAAFPPGGGKALVPHYVTFSQIVSQFTRTYRYTFDEATKHSQEYTVAIRNEPVVMEAVRARQMPTALLSWHLEPEDPSDPYQEENAKGLEGIVRRIPRFQQYRRALLEGMFYGRYGVQNFLQWDFSHGPRNLVVRDWSPVNGDKFVFRYDGTVGVLVHATWNVAQTALTDRGRAYFLSPEEREALVLHEFEPEDADFFEGDTAGAIHGVGIRGRIYWIYWLRAQVLGWLMEYLERVGAGGLTIYYYEHGNPASLAEVKSAAEAQIANNAILFPRYKDGSTGGPGIDRLAPNNAGADLLKALITDYFDNVIRRYIIGVSPDEDMPSGLGTGLHDLLADALAGRIKYDACDLDETLTRDLISVLNRYNCPSNPCPRFTSEVDRPNVAEYMDGVNRFVGLGGVVDEEGVRNNLALPRPIPGRPVLGMPEVVGGAEPLGGPGGDEENDGGTEGPDRQRRKGRRIYRGTVGQVRQLAKLAARKYLRNFPNFGK